MSERPMTQREVEAMIDAKLKKAQFTSFQIPRHEHNGTDAPRVHQWDIVPGTSAVGSITMASNQRYKLGLTFNPTQLLFFGLARGGSGERVQVSSAAKFGEGYYFTPVSSSSVTQGTSEYNVVQGGSWLWTENGGTVFGSRAIEGHLVNVDDFAGSGDIVARATIPNLSTQASLDYADGKAPIGDSYGLRSSKGYGEGFVYVDVTVASGWSIIGTFIVS